MNQGRTSNVFFTTPSPLDAGHLAIASIGQEECIQPYFFERPNGHKVEHMIFTIKGSGLGYVADREFGLEEGSLFIMPKEKPYSYRIAPNATIWTYCWIEFDGAWAKTLLAMHRLAEVYCVSGCSEIAPLLEQMFRLLLQNGNDSLHDAAGLFVQILAAAERRLYHTPAEKDAHRAALRQAHDYMLAHLAEPFSLNRVAGKAGMSRFHFSRVFKTAMGSSPREYLIGLRISRAQTLLREGTLSVKQVGHAVGYSVPQHFSKIFKRITGECPRTFSLK